METEEKKEEIVEEKKKSNIFLNIIILLVIFVVGVIMYAKYVGIKGLVVKEYPIRSELIPSNFSGVKVIYISDILYGSTINMDDVKELVDKVNLLKPDIVLFGGGLVSENTKLDDKTKAEVINELKKIDVKLGKYAIKGDKDGDIFDEVLSSSEFIVMNNSYELIYNEENTPICLSAVGSYNSGSYDINSSFAFRETRQDCFNIVFTHEADIIDKIMENPYKPNVILAGNTLGGEVNIPFYGPLNKYDGSINYYLDYYEIGDTQVYISSGLGTRDYDMRLFNHPSFNFFRLKSEHKN